MALFVKKDCPICNKITTIFKDRKIDYKKFELSTVNDYPRDQSWDIVSYGEWPAAVGMYESTVKKDLAAFTGKDSLP